MTETTTLWMRHRSFERAMRGAVAMTAKYPNERFAVGRDGLVWNHQWTLVQVTR